METKGNLTEKHIEDISVELDKKKDAHMAKKFYMCTCNKRDLKKSPLVCWNKCKNCGGWISDELLEEGY